MCVCLLLGCKRQESSLYRIQIDDLFGFIDDQGVIRIEPKFTYASDFHEGAAYARVDSVIGYINRNGKFRFCVTIQKEKRSIIKRDSINLFVFDSIWVINPPIHEQNPFFNSSSKYAGVWNARDMIIKPTDNDVAFSEGVALFYDPISSKFGYVNKRGKFIIPPTFSKGGKFINGLARVELEGNTGFIKRDGTILVKPTYRSASDFSEGVATCFIVRDSLSEGKRISTTWNTYVLDNEGHIVQGPQGHLLFNHFQDGNVLVTNIILSLAGFNSKTFFDKSLKQRTKEYFEDAKDFSENYAAIKINGKWGFINSSLDHFLDIKYDDVQSFKEGLAPVKMGDHWGYLDRFGDVVIDFKYENCTTFNNGLAYVWLNSNGFETEGYVNRFGKLVWTKE